MKKTRLSRMAFLLAAAVVLMWGGVLVSCSGGDDGGSPATLQEALNSGGTVNLDDYALSESSYTVPRTATIKGNARGKNFVIAEGAEVTFDGTKNIGSVTVGSPSGSNRAAARAATSENVNISTSIILTGSGVTISNVFIHVNCSFYSSGTGNSFGNVVIGVSVTAVSFNGTSSMSALVTVSATTATSVVNITISESVEIKKADQNVIESVRTSNTDITVPEIPVIDDSELEELQEKFEASASGTPDDGRDPSESEVSVTKTSFKESSVTWSKIAVSKYEVTQKEYVAIMGTNPSTFKDNPAVGETQELRPVECVSWYDALVYCNKRSIKEGLAPCYTIGSSTNPDEWGEIPTSSSSTWNAAKCNFKASGWRLQTKEEWQYAAGGGQKTQTATTWSGTSSPSELTEYAWYSANSGNKTHQVGTKQPNALGLYDMAGNTWEWIWDHDSWWHFCGGAYENEAYICEISHVNFQSPTEKAFGFRVVRTLE